MNKISKKIVSLVTMAAFALTLVPAAAFAATADVDPGNSSVQTVAENVQVTAGTAVPYQLNLKRADASVAAENAQVYVWVTDNDNNNAVVRNVTYYTDTAGKNEVGATSLVWLNNGRVLKTNYSSDGRTMSLSIPTAGNYTIHAGVDLDVANLSDTVNSLSELTTLNSVAKHSTIEVSVGDITGLTVALGNGSAQSVNDNADIVVNESNQIYANNTATQTVTVKATSGNIAAAGKDFTVRTNNSNITVTPTGTVTTDENGEFDLTYRASRAGTYYITLASEDGYNVRLVVKATSNESNYPATITGNSNDVTLNVDGIQTGTTLEDAVQFTIEDQNGGAYAEDLSTVEPAAGASSVGKKSDYVTLLAKPDGFKGEATDFTLYWDADSNTYTLRYDGTPSDLATGEYTVRVALYRTGANADVTFTLGEFDDEAVTDMQIVPSSDRVAYTDGNFTYKVILTDKNGVQKNVTGQAGEYYMGITSSSVVGAKFDTVDGTSGVTFNHNDSDKDQLIGSVITLTAVSDKYSKLDTAEVTLTDEGVVEGLSFDSDNGAANENNTVNVSVVDADGNIVNGVNGQIMAYVANSSNANANVDVQPGKAVTNGKGGSLTVFADEETTLDIVVAVVNTTTNKVYADTLTYTVGAEDVNADKMVAMTIGSSDYIVDNDIVNGDAAPYVDSAWRTMVPIRALAETFGATVDFTDNVVTIVDGDTTVVMTIGETTYTVNDKEATMDTAPVIGDGDRTYVPVRFVAEALGYTVTPLQDANGLTASVVFQK